VAAIVFDHTDVRLASAPINNSEQSFEVGQLLGKQLSGPPGLAGALILSDGLKVNGTSLLQGVNSVVPRNMVVTGGLAGDGPDFKRTWVIQDRKPKGGYVTAVGLYGDRVRLSHGSQGGWDIFGPERVITKSKGNVLFELDGKPALQLYKEYLGDKARELPASGLLFPLQIRSGADGERRLVRTILAVDESQQSMIFAGDLPQGYKAQLMRANFDRLIDGAASAAAQLANSQGPTLAVAISCVGRRLVLGERIEEEVEATLEKFPPGTRQIGFYSYGEVSPVIKGEPCELHNQTMTLTTVSEA
jgi:hypothetical protein